MDMSDVVDKSECPHRLYEASRVDHLQRGLKRALEMFDMDTSLTDAEKTLIATRVIPTLSQFQSTLYELKDVISSSEFTGVSVGEIMILKARVKDTSTSLFEIFENLKLPKVKPKWADLTDAGPGVGVSNYLVRFRDSEMARLYNSDYRYVVIDCEVIVVMARLNGQIAPLEILLSMEKPGLEWEKTKCFQGMTEEIDVSEGLSGIRENKNGKGS